MLSTASWFSSRSVPAMVLLPVPAVRFQTPRSGALWSSTASPSFRKRSSSRAMSQGKLCTALVISVFTFLSGLANGISRLVTGVNKGIEHVNGTNRRPLYTRTPQSARDLPHCPLTSQFTAISSTRFSAWVSCSASNPGGIRRAEPATNQAVMTDRTSKLLSPDLNEFSRRSSHFASRSRGRGTPGARTGWSVGCAVARCLWILIFR